MAKTKNKTNKTCFVCKKPGSKYCSRCSDVCYCSEACQKKHWKAEHRHRCFPPNSVCTRCLESVGPNTQTTCCVPHPEHLLQDAGKMFGPEGATLSFFCAACQAHYSKRCGSRFISADVAWIYEPPGSRWCYHGTHTIKPLKDTDHRRIMKDIIHLTVDHDIQDAIDALPESVRVLTIKSSGDGYNDRICPSLNMNLPQLEELQLIDVAFEEVTLNEERTPKLRKLEMQNIPDECEISIVCPALKDFEMRYHHGSCIWIDEMLRAATKLENFRSYKLGVDTICFASNELREVHLHRSDCLAYVSLWAPRLQYLRLQGCYSLDQIDIQSSHETLAAELPLGMSKSLIQVNTTNSCLSHDVIHTLRTHPRIAWDGEEEDEDAGVGSGMESIFMRMHQAMGSGDGW